MAENENTPAPEEVTDPGESPDAGIEVVDVEAHSDDLPCTVEGNCGQKVLSS